MPLFAMPIPRDWGGPELDPIDQLTIIEELAAMDASVGWCAMISCDGVTSPRFSITSRPRDVPDVRVSTLARCRSPARR